MISQGIVEYYHTHSNYTAFSIVINNNSYDY